MKKKRDDNLYVTQFRGESVWHPGDMNLDSFKHATTEAVSSIHNNQFNLDVIILNYFLFQYYEQSVPCSSSSSLQMMLYSVSKA